ncbi:MAG: hypothetical protein RIR69_142 [Actinomycetota bacterium]
MARVPAFQAGYAGSIPVTRSKRQNRPLHFEKTEHNVKNRIVSTLENTQHRGFALLGLIFVLIGPLVVLANQSDQPSATQVEAAQTDTGATSEPENDLVGDEPEIDATPVAVEGTPTETTVPTVADDCSIKMGVTLRSGSTGKDVVCVQNALIKLGLLEGPASGSYGPATRNAVISLQTDRELFIDGDVGRETAINLGVWPDEGEFVIRTPAPAPGATDLIGMPLSSVASAGENAPALPENSGKGRRIVYDRKGQRVWAVGKDGQIVRSWLVSGSMYSNEVAGTHKVYSRSEVSTAWNGKATLKKMVRWLKTERGALGFHEIPIRRSDKKVYQTEEELGLRLSGGCQRQAKEDADFMWKFATVGTPVVVL